MDFINKIVKTSLYDQQYKQIGRLPKFFNTDEKRPINHYKLDMWPGYTCQVKCLNDGFFLNVDTSTKFLQQTTVWDRIDGLLKDKHSQGEISELLCPKFDDSQSQSSGQSDIDARRIVVITSYNSASYQIEKILWDVNANTQKFVWKKKDPVTNMVTRSEISVAQYFEQRYGKQLAPWEAKLPLLYLTQRGEDVYLVPSRCHEASLPKGFTKDANKMRDLRSEMITEPRDRYDRINNLIESFAKANVLSKW